MNVAPPPSVTPKRGMPAWIIVLICTGAAVFLIIPVFAVLSIFGVRKYIVNAKTAEARYELGHIARAAAATHGEKGFCPSASEPVPAAVPHGVKYQSAADEWQVDSALHGGFACLGYSRNQPQYYQYSYSATGTERSGFEAQAHGDLNGDGVVSTFTISGEAPGGVVTTAPRIIEITPEE
jgi:type IV pilus assembly protein PilA